jgi:hypothetical protein
MLPDGLDVRQALARKGNAMGKGPYYERARNEATVEGYGG